MAVARVAGRHHAVEHVDAARHRLDDVLRLAHAHQVARLVGRQLRHGRVQRAARARRPARPPPGRRSRSRRSRSPSGRRPSACAAPDACRPGRCRTAPRRCLHGRASSARPSAATVPSSRAPAASVAGYGVHSSKIITMSESSTRWICMRSSGPRNTLRPSTGEAKVTPSLGDLAALGQRPDLEAAGVGQDRAFPAREAVQAAVRLDHLQSRAQIQVEGVAEDDLGAERAQLVGRHRLDRAVGAHRHEGRGLDAAARKAQPAAAGGAVGGEQVELHCA